MKVLVSDKQFVPHGHCYLWKPELVGLHIASDFFIALAYYSIPVTLIYFVRKRQDLPFNRIFLLFATFIITCGTSHIMEIWTLWYPTYWLSGGIKAITALVSLYTSLALIELIPKVLTLRSSAELEATNRELEREISERKQTELALQEREALLRRIGDNLPNGAIYKVIREKDGSDRFSYMSAGIERLTEVKAEDVLRDSSLLYSQFLPEDAPRLQAAVDESRRNMSVFDIQLRIQTPSGQIKWFHFRSTPRQLEDGRVVWDGLVVDVTDIKRSEEKLQRSETLLATAQKIAQMGSWEWHLETQKQIWSTETFRIFGLNPIQSVPQQAEFIQLVHPEDRPVLQRHLVQAIAKGNPFNLEYRIVRPDGSLRYLESRAEVAYDTQGQTIRVYGAILDITERKQTELEITKSRDLLEAIFNKSADALFLVDTQTLLTTNCNHRAVELFAASSKAELIGIEGQTLQKQRFTPDELTSIVAGINQQKFWSGEIEYLTKQGHSFWGNMAIKQIRVAEQVINLVRVTDISDRKRAQQMLELQAVITRNMAEGICLVRVADNIFVYANPKFEQMFGYNPGELIGQHVSIVNYGDENTKAEEVNLAIKTAVLHNGEATYEVQNVKKDGTPFWCSATTSVFEHPEYGKVLVAVQQDITDQKLADEQIKASLKEKEVLLQEIHHRVKNNLGIVSSLLQMQYRRTQDSQSAAILLDSQNRIASIALVHEKLYRSEYLAVIDFAQYIPDLTAHLFDSYNVKSSQIHLNIQLDSTTLDIETAIPCGLIINELVSNALKYAFPDHRTGEIQIKFSQQGDRYLTLIVRDNGVGLPADFNITKTQTLGTKLVQGLVKQLKGNIQINCQQGTEFQITFTKNRI